MRGTWALARMQLLSIRRRKLLVLPIIVALLILLLLLVPIGNETGAGLFAKESLLRVIEQILFAAGTFFGILIGSGAVAGDVESGTVLILAVRPVQRWQIFLGKLLGTALALLGVFLVWGLLLALVFEVRFDAVAGATSVFRFTLQDVLLSFPASLLLLVIATCLSAFLGSRAASALALVMWAASSVFHVVAGFSTDDLGAHGASVASQRATSLAIHVARGYDWMVPKHLLVSIPKIQGNAVDAPTWHLSTHQWIALGVIVAWAVLGMALFQQRESLAKGAE